jgi:PAS domain S-box-containing protein
VLVALAVVALILLGFALSPTGASPGLVLLNRTYAVIAAWVVAVLGWCAKGAANTARTSRMALIASQLDASAFRASGEPTMLLDMDGSILAMNPAGARMMGVPEHEAVGRRARDIVKLTREDGVPYAERHSIVRQVLANGEEHTTTSETVERRDGSSSDVERTITALREPETGEIIGAVEVTRDVSDRVAMEQAQADFLAMTSHELRTPLTAIHAAVGLVASGLLGDLPPRVRENIAVAQANSDRLLALVEDIVSLERLTLGRIKLNWDTCDSSDLLYAVAAQMNAAAKQAGITVIVTGEAIELQADQERLAQTLAILMDNAIKFSSASGTITLSGHAEGNSVVFEVRDTGVGIPAEEVGHIFETFQQVSRSDTRRTGGSGLGLAIAKRIVDQHMGRIWAESVEGQGSVFRFSVPVS